MPNPLSIKRINKLCLIAILVFFIFQLSGIFFAKFNFEIFTEEYNKFLKNEFLSDDKLYALAGWLYVHGHSPDEINFEHPPLAKYLIGLSEIAFGNHALSSLIFGVLTLVVVFLLSRALIKRPLLALMPVLALSLDKLFVGFSSSSMLDVYLTFFSSLSMLLFVKGLKNKRLMPLFYATAGLAAACKWIGVFVPLSALVYYAWRRDKWNLKFFPIGLALALASYSLTYLVFFAAGHGLQDFVSLQLRMYRFQCFMRFGRGTPPPLWLLLHFLTGVEGPAEHAIVEVAGTPGNLTVRTLSVEYGLSLIKAFNPLTWPLSFSASILSLYYAKLKGDKVFPIIPLSFFSLLALTSFGQVFIWYILPALPFAFISLTYFVEGVYAGAKNRRVAAFLILAYAIALSIWSLMVQLPSFIHFPIE